MKTTATNEAPNKKKQIIEILGLILFGVIWLFMKIFFPLYGFNFWRFLGGLFVSFVVIEITEYVVESIFNIKKEVQKFFVAILYGIVFIFVVWFSVSTPANVIEEQAPEIVNQIIEEHDLSNAKCNKVVVTEKISDKMYNGRAFINNGKNVIDIEIVIEGTDLHVSIPAAGLQFMGID
jgi:hypothetical protein